MQFIKQVTVAAAFVGACLALNSCSKDDDSNNGGAAGTSRLEVRLTDSPGDYEEVNINIKEVRIHTSATAGNNDQGWQTLTNLNPGIYNLLDFANGVDTLIASANLPAGHISQIRLVLEDSGNTIKLEDDNTLYDLDTPSAQQSGLKLLINADLVANVTYVLLLDFDVARSVLQTGNGQYKLKPVIRVITNAVAGGIEGTISPVSAHPSVFAVQGTDTIAGAIADANNGYFLIQGLAAGSYDVHFNSHIDSLDTILTSVGVTDDDITDMGSVPLP